jgi:hypothetical protein
MIFSYNPSFILPDAISSASRNGSKGSWSAPLDNSAIVWEAAKPSSRLSSLIILMAEAKITSPIKTALRAPSTVQTAGLFLLIVS